MSREEKLRELAEQEQALMREIYGFDNGVVWERNRIRKNIMSRVTDLKSCGSSNCNCQEFAELILDYLDDEWLGENK